MSDNHTLLPLGMGCPQTSTLRALARDVGETGGTDACAGHLLWVPTGAGWDDHW